MWCCGVFAHEALLRDGVVVREHATWVTRRHTLCVSVGQHHAKRVTTAHTGRCFSCGAMTEPAQTPTDPRPSRAAALAATRAREATRT
jgi:hypothetical protein